jgi:hypothetical protein
MLCFYLCLSAFICGSICLLKFGSVSAAKRSIFCDNTSLMMQRIPEQTP